MKQTLVAKGSNQPVSETWRCKQMFHTSSRFCQPLSHSLTHSSPCILKSFTHVNQITASVVFVSLIDPVGIHVRISCVSVRVNDDVIRLFVLDQEETDSSSPLAAATAESRASTSRRQLLPVIRPCACHAERTSGRFCTQIPPESLAKSARSAAESFLPAIR